MTLRMPDIMLYRPFTQTPRVIARCLATSTTKSWRTSNESVRYKVGFRKGVFQSAPVACRKGTVFCGPDTQVGENGVAF